MQISCKYIVLFALLASPLCADAGLRGRVSDPDGRYVPGVKVELHPGGHVVYSNARGEFLARDLEAGEYSLVATSPDFEPARAERVVLAAGGEAAVELQFLKVRTNRVQLDVIGGEPEEALREIPGSAFLIGSSELARSHPLDANEVLRAVPGVHIREDSGPVGMRLSIGIRGLNPDRSRTLLVLEDGLPLALAPYGEPEMYYSPPIERMSRVEILKGSGSILHGPQTIGGVLNFITPDPPLRPQGSVQLTGGQRGLFIGQASYGGTREKAGWYLNALRKQGDGWRKFHFDINDLTSKFNLALSDSQKIGVKLAFYDERSNSTYLGLTESQFRRDPNINLVPEDLLKVRRYWGSLLHQFVLAPRALLSTSLFGYTTTRNWRRQDFDRSRRQGVSYHAAVGDPAVPGDSVFLRETATHRNREFDVLGAESRFSLEHSLWGRRQHLELGGRYVFERHRDQVLDSADFRAASVTARQQETRRGDALSAFLQDRIFLTKRLTLTPGLRLEDYRYTRSIHRLPVDGVPTPVRIRGGDSVFQAIPGVGATFELRPEVTLFAGVHRGFAPPRVKDAITPQGTSLELDAELSWTYEAGARIRLARGLQAEATFFATDFENQIIPAAISGGATTTLINAGETLHRGAEFVVAADWSRLTGREIGLWTEVRHTYLSAARFTSGFYRNNRLPYAPRNAFGLRAGYRHRSGWALQVDGTRLGDQFADNLETVKGSADGTVGLLPAYWVWNLSAEHQLQRERFLVTPFLTVKNLANRIYISSRAPQGIQPGMFRQVNVGVKFRF